jgi:hypothetical protein
MTTAELAEFAFLQARPAIIFSRESPPAVEPLPPIRHLDAPPMDLLPGLTGLLEKLRYPHGGHAPDVPQAVQVLLAATGHQRYEPCNTYNTHRAFPSAQGKVPTEVFLRTADGCWHYDADRHQLRAVTGKGDLRDALSGPLSVIVAGRPGTLPDYYRELRWALTLCELGHAIELLTSLAHALGLPARLRTTFDDKSVLAEIGALPGDAWLPGAVLDLTPDVEHWPTPNSAWPDVVDPVLRADQLCWTPGPTKSLPADPSDGTNVDLPTSSAPTSSWAEVLYERTSGRAIGGFSASPETLPLPILSDILHAARTAATTRWGDAVGTSTGLRLLLMVERVDKLEDGLYEWPLTTGPLRLLRPGRLLASLQEVYFYPREVTRVDTCNIAAMFVVDYEQVLQTQGPRALRLSQLEMGAIAQASSLAAATTETFLRPSRSYDTDRLIKLLGLPTQLTVGYLCLGGRSRLHDLLLDMRI